VIAKKSMDQDVWERQQERVRKAGSTPLEVGEPPRKKINKEVPAAAANVSLAGKNKNNALSHKKPPSTAALQKQQPHEHQQPKYLHHSPFRIRVGCVVALRSRRDELPRVALVTTSKKSSPATTKTTSDTKDVSKRTTILFSPKDKEAAKGWIRVWTSPVPGRDEGLNLIGKRVRVQIPFVRSGQGRTVLEGEIIRLIDYRYCCDYGTPQNPSKKKNRHAPHQPLKVELLVDSRQLECFPFLKKSDDPLGASSSQQQTQQRPPQNSRQQRQRELELRIRGKGTVPVIVKLAPAFAVLAFGSSASQYFGSTRILRAEEGGSSQQSNGFLESVCRENAKRASSVGLTWAIERTVPSTPLGWWRQGPSSMRSLQSKSKKPPPPAESGESHSVEGAESTQAGGNNGRESHLMAPVGDSQKKNGDANGVHSTWEETSERNAPVNAVAKFGEGGGPCRSGSTAKKQGNKKKGPATTGVVVVAHGVRHAGDGTDPPERQVDNWRWLAGRYHDLLLLSSLSSSSRESNGTPTETLSSRDGLLGQILSGGLLGEVVSIKRADGDSTDKSLALVSIRRLVLPEHTLTGRHTYHTEGDVFDDGDGLDEVLRQLVPNKSSSSHDDPESRTEDVLIEIPIELLVIVSRKLHRLKGEPNLDLPSEPQSTFDLLRLSHSYSFREDAYRGLSPELSSCMRLQATSNWRQVVDAKSQLQNSLARALPSTDKVVVNPSGTLFSRSRVASSALPEPADFELPPNFMDVTTLPKPQFNPIARVKTRDSSLKRPVIHRTVEAPTAVSRGKRKMEQKKMESELGEVAESWVETSPVKLESQTRPPKLAEDYTVFKPTCARLLGYDSTRSRRDMPSSCLIPDRPRNLRQYWRNQKRRDTDLASKVDDKSNSRANRANQRRLLKDAAASASWLMGVNALSYREPQLRFDRSGIHSWGVYADEDIAAEDMIIEYRGELIDNAVAEKREKEYLDAKIGSDYMFRIDSNLVCDATKLGNVARFINASCDPNCYTKIITLDGNKRIVIYAKRDIRNGEELCYDYKFPLEYDESKRIPCHCGAKDCRGFMNWVSSHSGWLCTRRCQSSSSSDFTFLLQDKRYVVLADAPPPSKPSATSFVSEHPSTLEHGPPPDQMNSRDVSCGSRTPSPASNGKSHADSSRLGDMSVAN
jgi:histone-lysine N-methyltransferase SETD1